MSKRNNVNARKHGAFSQMIILPGEDRQEYEALHQAVMEEWDPQGRTQEDKVSDIVQNLWRKGQLRRRRLRAAERGQLEMKDHKKEIDLIGKFLEGAAEGKPLTELRLPAHWVKFCKEKFPRKNYESEEAWRTAVTEEVFKIGESVVLHGEKIIRQVITDPLCDPQAIEAELALEERLDAKIDRDIVALGRMKTMQSMGLGRRPQIIEVGSSKPAEKN
jgi:hypothetical protein